MRGYKICYEIQESICQNCNLRQVGSISWEATLPFSVLPPVFMGVNLRDKFAPLALLEGFHHLGRKIDSTPDKIG